MTTSQPHPLPEDRRYRHHVVGHLLGVSDDAARVYDVLPGCHWADTISSELHMPLAAVETALEALEARRLVYRTSVTYPFGEQTEFWRWLGEVTV